MVVAHCKMEKWSVLPGQELVWKLSSKLETPLWVIDWLISQDRKHFTGVQVENHGWDWKIRNTQETPECWRANANNWGACKCPWEYACSGLLTWWEGIHRAGYHWTSLICTARTRRSSQSTTHVHSLHSTNKRKYSSICAKTVNGEDLNLKGNKSTNYPFILVLLILVCLFFPFPTHIDWRLSSLPSSSGSNTMLFIKGNYIRYLLLK